MSFNGEIALASRRRSDYECQQMTLYDEIVGFEEKSDSECQQMTPNDEIVGFEGMCKDQNYGTVM